MPDRNWTILVVEAQQPAQGLLARCLQEDYQVLTTPSGQAAFDILADNEVDLVLCDLVLPDMSGVEFFSRIRIANPEAMRVLLTDCRDPDEVIRSINEAAVYQIMSRAWQSDQLRLLIRRALESRELARLHRYLSRELKFADEVLRQQNRKMTTQLQSAYEFDKLVFASDSMIEVCNLARLAAATDLPVLIQGETGTGKELMARAVHFFSGRKDMLFLPQNCGALPDDLLHSELFGHKRGAFTGAVSDRLGLFAAADGGTVFLDEIGDVSPAFQASLLRLLQDGEVKPLGSHVTKHTDVRIIAATNQRLEQLVEQNRFRRDLYFRLRGFELNLPPLRNRAEDIPILAEYAATKYAKSINRKIAGISAEALRRLRAHPFPGNVRELENEIRRMVALAANGEFLSLKHMSPEFARLNPADAANDGIAGFLKVKGGLKDKVESLETHLVSEALLRHKWNHSRAARELGISRVGLANKIRRYNLNPATAH